MGVCAGTRMKWRPWRTTHSHRGPSLPSVDTAFSRQPAAMEEVSPHWTALLPHPAAQGPPSTGILQSSQLLTKGLRQGDTIVTTSVSLPTSYLVGEISTGESYVFQTETAPWTLSLLGPHRVRVILHIQQSLIRGIPGSTWVTMCYWEVWLWLLVKLEFPIKCQSKNVIFSSLFVWVPHLCLIENLGVEQKSHD